MTNKRPILCLLNTGEQCDSCDVCGLFNKRFIQKRNLKDCVYDDYNKQNYNLDMVVVKLNELFEENEQLRQNNNELKNIINFTSRGDAELVILLMRDNIRLRQELQENRSYKTIEKGVDDGK